MISDAWVIRSAPCGSTCTASMDVDPEFNEPILHVAGYNIREAVKEDIKRGCKRRKGEI